ncbi:sperm-tail PG-rich repeat-containing protein 2 [Bombina bombina]|uniref:sperm-tail PG-rich repeat-containing protein 2 n=1 Tax=Bombina bombina TaxID=8345 RepID=UPI00235A5811|nr:sperm-tail PG-rich repeat-containing protein 2 [Bombina bombina]
MLGGYAPFLSMTKRDFGAQQNCISPGPGQYDISNVKEKVKGGRSLQNRDKRFRESVSSLPGPGTYDLLVGSNVDNHNSQSNNAQKLQKVILSNVKKHPIAAAPSIPTSGQSYGYEETSDGSLIKQLPPERDNTLGPAYYLPTNKETFATMKYKGVHFGKYTGKRIEFQSQDAPGPGEYDIDQESAVHYENVNSKKEDKKKYETFIPRYHEVIVLQEEKKGIPGPGNYEIKRQFDNNGERTSKSANIPRPPFLSMAKRFQSVKSITPAPGTYNEQRTAFEALKKISSSAQTPFGHSAVRFTQHSRLQKTPGPGSYDLFSHGLANESLNKSYYEKTNKGAFGSSAARALSMSKKDALWTPGPAHYVVKDKIEEPYKKHTSSAFSSGTQRLTSPVGAKESPAPGSYNVCEAFETTHGKGRYRAPRTVQAKRKHASFLSAAPRTLEIQTSCTVPGPGAYNPMMRPESQRSISVPRQERFKEPMEVTPGPGAYEVRSKMS